MNSLALWTARDWRMMFAIALLGGSGVAMTVIAWRALDGMIAKSVSPIYIAYFSYGTLLLIGIVIIGLSAILGRRVFKFKVGDKEIEASGEDAERIMDKAE